MTKPRTTGPRRLPAKRPTTARTSSAWTSPRRSDEPQLVTLNLFQGLFSSSAPFNGMYAESSSARRTKEAMPSTAARTESDSFGPIQVPADAYWGAQTERSIENFPFGPREQMPLEIVHALG